MLKQSSRLKNFSVNSLVNEVRLCADKQRREKKNHMKIRTHYLFHCIFGVPILASVEPTSKFKYLFSWRNYFSAFSFLFLSGGVKLLFCFFFSHFLFAFAFDSANIKQINIKLNFLGSTTTRSYSFQLGLAGSNYWSCQIAIVNRC